MSLKEVPSSSSPRQGYDIFVRNVSTDEDYQYLLSSPGAGRRSPQRTDDVPQDIFDTADAVSSLIQLSPGRKFLVISPKSRPRSPDQMQSFDFDDPLGGQQIILLGHHSKVSIAEHAVVAKLRNDILLSCFQFMKALWHWKHKLASKVFMRIRKWAIASKYLRVSEHKAHQKEVIEQQMNLKVLVSHHTASSRARTEKKEVVAKTPSKTLITRPAKPSFRPSSSNPMLQIQTKFPTTPVGVKKMTGLPKKSSPTRQASVQFVRNKYFQSASTNPKTIDADSTNSKNGESRSTTPTSLATNVSSLASHRFYHQSRALGSSADSPMVANPSSSSPAGVVAEPGFDRKPLVTASLSSSPDAAAFVLRTRVFSSPDRSVSSLRGGVMMDSPSVNTTSTDIAAFLTTPERQPLVARAKSPLQAFQDSRKSSSASVSSQFTQRTPVLRPHLNGMSPAATLPQSPTTLQVSASASISSSIACTPPGHCSPSAAEMAYARSRGSNDAPHSPHDNALDTSALSNSSIKENLVSVFKDSVPLSGVRVRPTTVVLPVLPRLGKLQAVLSQHRSRPLPSRALPLSAWEPVSLDNGNGENFLVREEVKEVEEVEIDETKETPEVQEINEVNKEASTSEQEEKSSAVAAVIAACKEREGDEEKEVESDEAELLVLRGEPLDGNTGPAKPSTPAPAEYSVDYMFLAFRKMQRKIYQIQDRQTRYLRALLPAMEYHINVRLVRAFRTLFTHNVKARTLEYRAHAYHAQVRLGKAFRRLRARYLEAKISRYRSFDGAINIDNFALTKAFWRLRKNVTHRHQSWFIEQRGVKYHRFLRLSQALSSLMQFGAYGNVAFEGDAGRPHDIEDEVNEESEVFKTAALLVQGLGASDSDFNFDTSDSEEEGDRSERNYLPEVVEEDFSDRDEKQDSVGGERYSGTDKATADEAAVQELTRWESQLQGDGDGDTHSESSAEHEAFEIGAISPLGLRSRSSDNSPSPLSPHSIDLSHFMHAPHGLLRTYPPYEPVHQAEIRRQISRSRSDEFPGVSGIDMWDWQDLHSVSREFISDSECDSSREATDDALARSRLTPPLPTAAPVTVPRGVSPISAQTRPPQPPLDSVPPPATPLGSPGLKVMRRMSSRSLSISPIYSAETTPLPPQSSPTMNNVAPAWGSHDSWREEETERDESGKREDQQQREGNVAHREVSEQDESSDISLFLSDDSHDSHDEEEHFNRECELWVPSPRQKNNNDSFSSPFSGRLSLNESAIVHQASPSSIPKKKSASVAPFNAPNHAYPVKESARGEPGGATTQKMEEHARYTQMGETKTDGSDFPPLPSSPCPSDDDRETGERGAEEEEDGEDIFLEDPHLSLTDYISQSDSDDGTVASFSLTGEKEEARAVERSTFAEEWSPSRKDVDFGASFQNARAYWRRTKLSQGLYALSQWVVRNQTLLTMNDILYEFQALRKLRRGLKTLREIAML